ncbi:MAG: hypothetical protein GX902_03540 [Lentisphaerae bacterium]|nr:hypothetical protein [Lentisphaerota bacterium]
MDMDAEREAKLDILLAKDNRYDRAAYLFVCQAVNIIAREIAVKKRQSKEKHISSLQLLQGMKKLLLAKYGCMAIDVLQAWNVNSTDDFGNIVFNLADVNLLGTSENDSREDFNQRFSFHDAFVAPFQAKDQLRKMPVINL